MQGRSVPFKLVYLIAESQMVKPFHDAAQSCGWTLSGFQLSDLKHPEEKARFRAELATADVFFGSMLTGDAEVESLAKALAEAPPPIVVVFHSEPSLVRLSRLGAFSAEAYWQADSDPLFRTVQTALAKGVRLPPQPMVVLSSLPRLLPLLPEAEFPDLHAYGRCILYWHHGSPQNLGGLLRHLARFLPGGEALPSAPEPILYPDIALWHPKAPSLFPDLARYLEWYGSFRQQSGRRVGLVLFRQYVTSENCGHYAAAIAALEEAGLDVVPGYAHMDATPLLEVFQDAGVECVLNLAGFNLVGSMGHPNPQQAAELLSKLDVPYLVGMPLLFQSQEQWESDPIGLAPTQAALQVVMSELDGGIDPRVYGGPADGVSGGRESTQVGHAMASSAMASSGELMPNQAEVGRMARRVGRWVELRRKERAERRVAITLFSFPPDKGSLGSAAYLDVFESLHRLLRRLAAEGYTVDVPPTTEDLLHLVLGADRALPGAATVNVADRMDVATYRKLVPAWKRIEKQWGPPPGRLDSDGRSLLIKGRTFGNVFVGIQPSFGYEGDPMRLLLSPDASPSHSFAAYYAWVQHVWKADALLHFGTHGALEFMPGKQVGLTAACYPDMLVDELPHLYLYSINNPSEATIAKRRSGALIVSYLSPPLAEAGLYKKLSALKEAVDAFWHSAEPARRNVAYETVRALAAEAALEGEVGELARVEAGDKRPSDVGELAPGEASSDTSTEAENGAQREVQREVQRDAYVRRLATYLRDLETRLIPVGLHIAGEPPTASHLLEFLWAESQYDRPEVDSLSLPALVAGLPGPGREAMPDPSERSIPSPASRPVTQPVPYPISAELAEACKTFLRLYVEESAAAAAEAWRQAGGDSAVWAVFAARVDRLLQGLQQNSEMEALIRALDGRFIAPSPGGDPIRQPNVLPTGRNIHAVDPHRIPSAVAWRRGQQVVGALVQRLRAQSGGAYPESVAMVLWGTDNIKTQGEGVAQALALLGVVPEADAFGRMTGLRLVPLEELGRPRIDVVMTVSGIFRDIFPTAVELLDRAVRLAASADEPLESNFVRKRTLAVAQEVGCSFEAATARVYANAPGAYGTGVNHVVEASDWDTPDDLGAMFLTRKGFAYGATDTAVPAEKILAACLKSVSAAFQNLDSTEISLSDVDHYYEYLGGLNAAIGKVKGASGSGKVKSASDPSPSEVPILLYDATTPHVQIRDLPDAIRLESRTRLLNPKWYQGMLAHGYQGVHEIAVRLENTFGWSATTDAVDAWIYSSATDTFVMDEQLRRRMSDLNPRAVHRLAERLQEAAVRGFWQPNDAQAEGLRAAVDELEDEIEGVA